MSQRSLAGACLALAALVAACGDVTPPAPNAAGVSSEHAFDKHCVDVYDPAADYYPEKPTPRYAQGFTVEYHRHYKVVNVTLADAEAQYVLVRCGTPVPDGVEGTVVRVPVRRVVTTSTTELPHLESLGLLDHLVGHDKLDYVSSAEVRRRLQDGRIAEVGESFQLNLEVILVLEPDLVLAASLASNTNDAFSRLGRAGVAVAHVPSFLETTSLGRAEWILFTALFFDAESEAAAVFDGVARRYEELAARGRARQPDGPTVFASGPDGDTWYVPGGRSFMARLVADAGGRYLWADDDSSGSLALALESVFDRALPADVWLHPSRWRTLEEVAAVDRRFTALRAFREGRVYQNDARHSVHQADGEKQPTGANDYWEQGTARPDLVLADLLKIFHPEVVPEHELTFHRRLE